MAKQNRDYGIGYEFLAWTIVYASLLIILILWVLKMNLYMVPQI
jgi:hypothetical protein